MKPYPAVIFLVLLMTSCSRCYKDQESDDSGSQEYHPARDGSSKLDQLHEENTLIPTGSNAGRNDCKCAAAVSTNTSFIRVSVQVLTRTSVGCSQTECGQTAKGAPISLHKTVEPNVQARVTLQSSSLGGYNFTYKGSHIAVTNSDDSKVHTDIRLDSRVVDIRSDGCKNSNRRCGVTYSSNWRIFSNAPSSNRPSDEVSGNERPQTKITEIRTTTTMPDTGVGSKWNSVLGEEQENVGQATEQDTPSFLPSPPNCGISLKDRIVGGTQTGVGKWPWLVAYGFKDKRTSGVDVIWMCGGSLVTERHTITVAHCADISTYYIDVARIGDIYLNSTVDEMSIAEERKVKKKIIIHPNYSKLDKKHDIAIVTLIKPFSQRYKPICLPFRRDMRNNKFASKQSYVTGWGATEYASAGPNGLLDVKLPIVDNEFCRDVYASKRVFIGDQHICAGGEAGKDACRGDSGGPLMLKNDGEASYYLIGVVAFGYICGSHGVPGVYTRITSHLDWLEANLKK